VNLLALCRIAIHSKVLKVDIIDRALLGRSRADKSSEEDGDVDDSDGLHIERLGKRERQGLECLSCCCKIGS